jgi:hypothetical protein
MNCIILRIARTCRSRQPLQKRGDTIRIVSEKKFDRVTRCECTRAQRTEWVYRSIDGAAAAEKRDRDHFFSMSSSKADELGLPGAIAATTHGPGQSGF